MPGKTLTDSELFEAIKLNDEKAFNLLFERHWSTVYSVAHKYVKDEEAALEIAHDIFLNIWTKRLQLNISLFKAYVITAASYHGIRKRQTLKAIPIQYVEDYEYAEDTAYLMPDQQAYNDGETKLDEQEMQDKIDILLNDLPKRCREIYSLSRRDNLSINEIAVKLGISKRTVENQLTVALKHLRTSLRYLVVLACFCNATL
ncbi:MAG: sigma-70 family RNA polymerase sigma factor [Mucilaginibacter sp.]|uniref:sigma-70 family RNA polymerase sigma factor n=1 Tax=Mucilaginibacter sp. TaxID=1882438 RepID=UPI0032636907